MRHFYEHVTEKHRVAVSYNWLRLMLQEAGVVEKEPARGKYRRGRERRPMVGMLMQLDASGCIRRHSKANAVRFSRTAQTRMLVNYLD